MNRNKIKIWLKDKSYYYEGLFMRAEEKDDYDKMSQYDEKNNNINEILRLLDEI